MTDLHRLVPANRTNDPQPKPTADQTPISEQDIGEYREQDRFLPVCFQPPHPLPALRLLTHKDRSQTSRAS
jgi:hypothetical protein